MAWTTTDLTSVENAIRAKISGNAVAEYRIGDRSLRYFTLAELQSLRDKIKSEVEALAGQGPIAVVRFGRPT